jgi:XisH protein
MAKDLYHDNVCEALQKEGWLITQNPYKMEVEKVTYEIDLGAEPIVAAEKEGNKIAVEIKSFAGASTISEFHRAVGQFVDYTIALQFVEPDRQLYLAVPMITYNTFFQKNVIKASLDFINCKLIVYNPLNNTIVSWIK